MFVMFAASAPQIQKGEPPMIGRSSGRWASFVATVALLSIAGAGAGWRTATAQLAFPLPGTIVATAEVNVRSCPKLTCERLAVAELGEPVAITGEAVDGFVPVEFEGEAGFVYYLYVAPVGGPAPQLVRGEPGCQRVAFIFNVGIGEEAQTGILDYLKSEDVPATIFPMGWWADAYPEIVEYMVEQEFVIGSHGDDRMILTDRPDAEVAQDVRDSFAAIERAAGVEPEPIFTPYAAEMDDRVRGIVAAAGYLPVFWEVSAGDYGPDATQWSVYERVMFNVYDGAIVEFHMDGPASATSTGAAMPSMVEELKAAGYTFVSIPEMARPCDPTAVGADTGTATPAASPTP